jgi:hypothetical protein
MAFVACNYVNYKDACIYKLSNRLELIMDLHNEEHVRALTESLVRASLDGSQVRVKLIAGEEGDDDNTVDLEDNTGKYPVFDMHLHPGPFGGVEGTRLATDDLVKYLQFLGVQSCALCGIGQRIVNSPAVYYADPAYEKLTIVPSLCNDFRNAWFKDTMIPRSDADRVNVCLTGFTLFHEPTEPGGIRYAYDTLCAEFGTDMISGFGEFNVIKQAITAIDPINMRGLHQVGCNTVRLYSNFKQLLTIQHNHTKATGKLAPLLMHCDMGNGDNALAYVFKIQELLAVIDEFKKEMDDYEDNALVWLHFGGICPEMAPGAECDANVATSKMEAHVQVLTACAHDYPWLHFGMAWEKIYDSCLLGATRVQGTESLHDFMNDFIDKYSNRLHAGSDYVSDGGKNIQKDYSRAILAPVRTLHKLPRNVMDGTNTEKIFRSI